MTWIDELERLAAESRDWSVGADVKLLGAVRRNLPRLLAAARLADVVLEEWEAGRLEVIIAELAAYREACK